MVRPDASHCSGSSVADIPLVGSGSPPLMGYMAKTMDLFLTSTVSPSGERRGSDVSSGVMARVAPEVRFSRKTRGGLPGSVPVNATSLPSCDHVVTPVSIRTGPRSNRRDIPASVGYRIILLGLEGTRESIHLPSGEIPVGSPSPRRTGSDASSLARYVL